jgi:hypothetical protein
VLEGLRQAVVVVLVAGLAVRLGSNLRQEFGSSVARARGRVYRKRKDAVQFWLTLDRPDCDLDRVPVRLDLIGAALVHVNARSTPAA